MSASGMLGYNGADNPPRADPPPGAVHAGRYGQQEGGTHPTGMHILVYYGDDILSPRLGVPRYLLYR